jgi:hypothetical protein
VSFSFPGRLSDLNTLEVLYCLINTGVAAVGKLWPGQNGLDLRTLSSTRSSMDMKVLCTVRSLFSAFAPFELAIVDASLFPTDARSFVREGRRSVLE